MVLRQQLCLLLVLLEGLLLIWKESKPPLRLSTGSLEFVRTCFPPLFLFTNAIIGKLLVLCFFSVLFSVSGDDEFSCSTICALLSISTLTKEIRSEKLNAENQKQLNLTLITCHRM